MSIPSKKWKYDKTTRQMVDVGSESTPDVDAPYVQDDTIPATVSHATDEGLVFTSRSELEAHYKANGFECTGGTHHTGRAVGPNRKQFESEADRSRAAEWGMLNVDPDVRATVLELKRKVKWGMAPLSEREKERCLREERLYQQFQKAQSR